MPKLKNKRHEAFVKEYRANGFNALQAYKKVYKCSNTVAHKNGSKLLAHAGIKARMDEFAEKDQKKYNLTLDKLIEELEEIEELAKQPIHGKNGFSYDITNWLKIKQEKAKLFGLYAPTKTDSKVEVTEAPPLEIDIT